MQYINVAITNKELINGNIRLALQGVMTVTCIVHSKRIRIILNAGSVNAGTLWCAMNNTNSLISMLWTFEFFLNVVTQIAEFSWNFFCKNW